ncbi:hypothetical protein T552_01434 [Pneumocystis carinii B80]|uniref:Nucleolar complex protein 2 n=1 Tax=Pneumocystis carinii (strain B80) TaxID=1408658 RepID=A0A0W4ZKA8_PNEC8|nr:hypothetical protein T552_01434 [Pneumocystis carinii B80]KTW28804.1 hypothetical protein T552_01434 [Pneumocystis carinii B80]
MAKISKSTKKFEKKRLQKALERRRAIKKIRSRYKSSKNRDIKEKPKETDRTDSGEEISSVFFSENAPDSLSEGISGEEESDEPLSRNGGHKAQLEALKEEDPEFYKYLEEEEAELLEFQDSDIEKIEEEGKKDDMNRGTLTLSILEEWEKGLIEEKSLKILKKLVIAVHKVVKFNEKTDISMNSIISDPEVFNALIVLAFKQVPYILYDYFQSKKSMHKKEKSRDEKKEKELLFIFRVQFSNVLRLLHDLTDPNMLNLILKGTEKLIPCALTHRKFMKNLIKLLANLWSTQSHDQIRNSIHSIIEKIFSTNDKNYIEYGLKTFYTAFIQQSSQTNAITLPFICSMKDFMSKLFGVDQVISYQISFKCIRQLAIYLRNAIVKQDKVSYKEVYNWKYVNSIDFWSLVLSNYYNKIEKKTHTSIMQDLIYPLVQVTLGTIKFASLVQFFPLKFHLIRSLIRISHHTKVYIPLAPYIFEVLESKEIKNKPSPSTAKPIDFELCIRAPKSYLKGKVYQDGLIEQIIELLQEIYSLQCKSIAFPEMAMPIIIQIKRYIKQSKNPKLNKMLSIFIEKLKENSEFINSRRSSIEFSPGNIDEMCTFLEDYDWDKTPLGKYVCQQRRIRQKLKKVETN